MLSGACFFLAIGRKLVVAAFLSLFCPQPLFISFSLFYVTHELMANTGQIPPALDLQLCAT